MSNIPVNDNSPFKLLSELLVDNQNAIRHAALGLRSQIRTLNTKLEKITEELENDIFSTNLNLLSDISNEASEILLHAKNLESSRERILDSVEMLKKANTQKLN
tara:strand:+ start:329 stop:640 length:312 start_codon:yes stop_codon:yes gene_type:complete